MSAEAKLVELGFDLPAPPAERGKLCPAVRTGNLVFTSGHTSQARGKVGKDLTVEEGYEAARDAILGCLSSVRALVGSLDTVSRVVHVLGCVNAADGFVDMPNVIHGATDLLLDLFGPEAGWHTRSALGFYQLPGNAAVEIEIVVEVTN